MKWYPMEQGLFGVMTTGLVLFLLFPNPAIRKKGTAFFVGWFFPGAGHAMLGRWKKGLFFFLTLSALYIFGLWICGFRTVSFDDNPFYYVGQYGSGLTLFLHHVISVDKAYPIEGLPLTWYDPGLLYVCATGLLNLIIALNTTLIPVDGARPAVPAPEPEPKEATS